MFDTIIVQPIFNLLLVIYGLIPGSDFGLSVILFAVIVRLLMWPLVKKQLHQTKVMRKIQPELKKVKAKAKGNKQLEGQLMMELYRERGVNPFSSLGLLLVQLPIFIALFRVIQVITQDRNQIAAFAYDFVEQLPAVGRIVANPEAFNETLFNVVDLTARAVGPAGIYIPLLILAFASAILQYYQSKQLVPEPTSNKRLRDIFKDSAQGKNVDQSEISAIMSRRMILIFPFIAFAIALYFPGALVLFYATTSAVAVIQQRHILNQDVEEMEELADQPLKKKPQTKKAARSDDTTVRVLKATEAEVVAPKSKPKSKKSKSGKRKRR